MPGGCGDGISCCGDEDSEGHSPFSAPGDQEECLEQLQPSCHEPEDRDHRQRSAALRHLQASLTLLLDFPREGQMPIFFAILR